MRTSFDDIITASLEITGHRSGTEKRLEVDFAAPHELMKAAHWDAVINRLETPILSEKNDDGLLSIICEGCMLLVTPMRIVVLSNTKVLLHMAASAIKEIAQKNSLEIQWASFMRKNTVAAWNQSDKSMAAEFIELKKIFAKGHAYIFGPADKDHYFYFVYDNIKRSDDVVESDVQINMVMYEVENTKLEEHLPQHVQESATGFQGATSLGGGEYEAIRVDTIDGVNCATFESSSSSGEYGQRIKILLDDFRPTRFSLTVLADPQSNVSALIGTKECCGFGSFEGYTLTNRTSNEFAPGYAVNKFSFVSAAN